ncbi:hypothetical protein K470DRAFT_229598 [Piedraia hortae CBS 480.64]|uniref:NADH-ubiquinone oxidoreductase B12 subunit n=1 Tax=Piedraia hortae CBS 480.64 TaxID=1314780 RepID=A0A6A7C5G1_9PEZI|nr:hypothetical protein K470DRAFT_229598 [Piedraia hortae CBS 480.64]
MPPRPDLTGFDPQKLAASSGFTERDPWKRAEAWRYTGPFTRMNRFRGLFPGFGIASVAFAGYLVYEGLYMDDPHEHGKDHH